MQWLLPLMALLAFAGGIATLTPRNSQRSEVSQIASKVEPKTNNASEPPSPSTGEIGEPPQPQAAKPENDPKTDKRGTSEFPIIVRSIITQEEADQQAADREEKSLNDRRLVVLTGMLVFVTAGLVIYTGFLSGDQAAG
jgi:hypothetical protein